MKPKLASKAIVFGLQIVHPFRIVSKFSFKANLASNGPPNGIPNGVQNRGHELAVRASVRAGASGPTKHWFWNQFEANLSSLGLNFESNLGQFATKNVSRIDPLCVCCYITCTTQARKTSAYDTHGKARWRNTRACALDNHTTSQTATFQLI